jgi:16S rRNA (adenine1518-N6/adenine1519-N6)-dimethyltransferase
VDPRKLSELDPFLKERGLKPKRSLSQNFLIDANVLRKIVKTAEVSEKDQVLEIGPGPGGLTKTLIEEGAFVTAIEIDKKYAELLPIVIKSPNLKVLCKDFLEFTPTSPYLVVANIPYHISSPIIEKLAEHIQFFPKIFLTVQKEFAERLLCKKPSSASSIFIDFYFDASISFTISKECFYPKPKVPSALLSLISKKTLPLPDSKLFIAFVKHLFRHRRKMIKSILGLPDLTEARPESLNLEKFIELFLFLQKDNRLPKLSEELNKPNIC